MRLLATITNASVGLPQTSTRDASLWPTRHAARAIVFRSDGKIAMMRTEKYGYHKLPGGGMDAGESWQEACVREILEETGCVATLRAVEVGMVIEHRNLQPDYDFELVQTSYCGIADVSRDTGAPALTDNEIETGLCLVWLELEDALTKLHADVPLDWEGRFIRLRDIAFLQAARAMVT